MSTVMLNVEAQEIIAKLRVLSHYAFSEGHAPVWSDSDRRWEEVCYGKSLMLRSLAEDLERIIAEYERQARKAP